MKYIVQFYGEYGYETKAFSRVVKDRQVIFVEEDEMFYILEQCYRGEMECVVYKAALLGDFTN